MKDVSFTFNASEWKKDLMPIFSIIKPTAVIHIIESLHISIAEGIIKIRSTDLSIDCDRSFPVDTKEHFTFCVLVYDFKRFINSASILNPECTFSIGGEFITLSSDSFRLKLKRDPDGGPDNFPKRLYKTDSEKISLKMGDVAKESVTYEFTVDATIMRPYLQKALNFVSNDDLRPAMCGISFRDNAKHQLELAATDAHRLYWEDIMPTPESLKGMPDFILDKPSANLFLLLFKTGNVTITIRKYRIWFENDNTWLSSRLVDARFPDYMFVIPNPLYELVFYFNRKQLKAFLTVAANFANKSTRQLEMSVTKESVSIEGGDYDRNVSFSYNIPILNASVDFLPFKFGINVTFLLQIASLSTKDEFIKINHPENATKAMIIDNHYLLMPLHPEI